MPRKKTKIPQEYQDFKQAVEKHGYKVTITLIPGSNDWCVTVLKGKHCIWHNCSLFYDLPLTKFWESKAWKLNEVPKEQI